MIRFLRFWKVLLLAHLMLFVSRSVLAQLPATFNDHGDQVRSLAFSPKGTQLVSGSDDGTIRVWDVLTGKALHVIRAAETGRVTCVAFSGDGTRIASAGDGAVTIWDAASGRLIETLDRIERLGSAIVVAFSPDDQAIAVGYSSGLVLHRQRGITSIAVLSSRNDNEIPRSIVAVAFSPDGRTLAAGAFNDPSGTVELWDVKSKRRRLALKGHNEASLSVAFSPDGNILATADGFKGEGTVKLWTHHNGFNVKTLESDGEGVSSVAFSPDGKTIATGGREIMLWDAVSGKEHFARGTYRVRAYCIAFSPLGNLLASCGSDMKVRLWRVTNDSIAVLKYEQ